MITNYGEIPDIALYSYMKSLIGKTYKILPMKEENSPTLKSYINSYIVELIGFKNLVSFLCADQQFLTLITTLVYLATEDYDKHLCKKEVFKCIHIVDGLNNKYFSEGV